MAARPRIDRAAAHADIAGLLTAWYQAGHRDLPWRRTSDPYRIWVSEIMLQQTRAQAVIPYYGRFLARFPTLESLAAASEEETLALWSGLGYYSRARNLRRAARRIAETGAFPRTYEGIRALEGVGDYTAAAIASIAFGLPYAAIDGNVLRVVARLRNDAADIGSARTRARFRGVVQEWMGTHNPGVFNQALMELGATVCLPKTPLCGLCPLEPVCRGARAGATGQLPVKLRGTVPVRLEGVLLVVRRAGRVLLRQRAANERRMAAFWELPSPEDLPRAKHGAEFGEIRHTITHHHYRLAVRAARAGHPGGGFRWFAPRDLAQIPLSTTARKALKLAGIL